MKHTLVLLSVPMLFAFVVGSFAAAAPPSGPVAFDFLCTELLQETPNVTDYVGRFDPDFIAAISEETLEDVFASLQKESGSCLTQEVRYSGNAHLAILHAAKTKDVYVTFSTSSSSGLIDSLLIDGIVDESIVIETWADVESVVRTLDPTGKLSATLMTSNGSLKQTVNENEVFAIGSTFKLYVLGALDRAVVTNRFKWDDVLPLREDWKSLPSGVMQNWPAGQRIDLKTYAAAMISQSDNTATDHLINHVGRVDVEAMLAPMGNSNMMLPLLTTLEFFKLKWGVDAKVADQYVLGDRAFRLAALKELEKIPREAIGFSPMPTRISTIEWFGTTPETCQAILWLAEYGSQTTREILAISTPFVKTGAHWKYAGYKGGSEPGVVSMTYVLESKAGTRACLSVSWNNETTPVSEYQFFSVMKKVIAVTEKLVP